MALAGGKVPSELSLWLCGGPPCAGATPGRPHARGFVRRRTAGARAGDDREIAVARNAWDAAKAAGADEPLSWRGTYPSLRTKRRIAYGKSMIFLDALRSELRDAAFWRGVRRYTKANAGRSVTAADFQAAFEAASGRDLSAIFKTWVFGD